jgi:hypothetical protein
MTQTASASARKTLTARLGTSPKTLHRKAMDKAAAAHAPEGEALEELFPAPPADADGSHMSQDAVLPAADNIGSAADSTSANADQAATAPTVDIIESSAAPTSGDEGSASPPSTIVEDHSASVAPVLAPDWPAWSQADEKAYQLLLSRRKVAGFQKRGRDVSAQTIRTGAITPNSGTVNSAIFELVKLHGPISRGQLLDLMATPAFAHPKAKGSDRAWSQGYLQGAISSGFLQIGDQKDASASARPTETAQSTVL